MSASCSISLKEADAANDDGKASYDDVDDLADVFQQQDSNM